MSGDPEQGYFADGIAEDIITDLSKVSGVTREKLYDLTRGTSGTRVLWLTEHENEEDANIVVRVHLKPALRLRNLQIDLNFAELGVKGRASQGNLITKHLVDRVSRIPKAEQEEIVKKRG